MISFPPLFRDAILICIVLLLLSSSIGYGTLSLFPQAYSIMQIGNDEIVLHGDESTQEYIVRLFASNLGISLIGFLGGFFFGVGPLVILIMNGFMFGAIFKLLTEKGGTFLVTLLPHMCLEIPAFLIACSLGLLVGELCWCYVRNNECPGYRIRDLIWLFLLYPVPLLLIAAIIEGFLSVQLLDLAL